MKPFTRRKPRAPCTVQKTKQGHSGTVQGRTDRGRASALFLRAGFFVLVLAAACAKKLPPTSPDRFAPGLRSVLPIDRVHLQLVFTEPIDPDAVSRSDFTIGTPDRPDSAVLRVISVSGGGQPDNLVILTEPQEKIPYVLVGAAADTARNLARFKKRFTGTITPDTTPPRIVSIFPGASAIRVRPHFEIRIGFSEPLDTLERPVWTILPSALKKRIDVSWAPDQAAVSFTLADSLGSDTTVYFVLAPTVADLSANRLLGPGFTVFTTDTALPRTAGAGELKYQGMPVSNGFVLFYSGDTARAAAVSDLLGAFTVPLAPGEYRIRAFVDTARRGTAGLGIEIPVFKTGDKNPVFELKPLGEPLPLDEFFQ